MSELFIEGPMEFTDFKVTPEEFWKSVERNGGTKDEITDLVVEDGLVIHFTYTPKNK